MADRKATKADAKRVLAAIKARWPVEAREYPPVIVADPGYGAKYGIVWEGPLHDWPSAFTMGTCCKADWPEYPRDGYDRKALPGVFLEPINGCSLAIYPD
jgi:hypothetical protein